MRKKWKHWQTLFFSSKITVDSDCSHEIKGCLLLGRKAMTNLNSVLKSKDITQPTKVFIVKTMVSLLVVYRCEAEHWRVDGFKQWCWWRLLRVPWTVRRSNQSILKKSTLNIHWKDWCWSSNTLATCYKELTHWKRPWCWERIKAKGEGGKG